MKKLLILAAAAALTLASCAKVETTTKTVVDENVPIAFANYIPRSITKAAAGLVDSGTSFAQNTQFGVFAWATTQTSSTPWTNGTKFAGTGAPGFMNNVGVTYKGDANGSEGNNNEYSPTRYWPSGDTPDGLSFIAYYPYSATSPLTANVFGATAFTVASTAATQIDLMVSDVVPDQYYGHTNGSYDGTVDLKFHHLLTKVKFVFKTDNNDNNTTVTLTKAQLKGIFKTNNLTIAYDNTKAIDLATSFGWGTANTAETFDVTIDGVTPATTAKVLSTTATTPTDADVFLMVPQAIADDAQKIDLVWTVTSDGVTTTNAKTVDLYDILTSTDDRITWDQNSQIVYTITIGPKPIKFTAELVDWATVINGGIAVN